MRNSDQARRVVIVGVLAVLLALLLSPAAASGTPASTPKPAPAQGHATPTAAAPSSAVQAKSAKPHTGTAKTAKPRTGKAKTAKARAAKADPAPAPVDQSNRLPRTARDEITGDFLGYGYDQHARVEGSNLNIYAPPGKGGGLLKSTPTDVSPPHPTTWPVFATWGSENWQNCGGCFDALDAAYHFLTVFLAYDGTNIYLTGYRGSGTAADPYANVLYVLAGDGSCASQVCSLGHTDLNIHLSCTWTDSEPWRYIDRAVATTALAVGKSGNATFVAVGGSDYGVGIYYWNGANLYNTDNYAAMAITSDPCTQTPITALAWDPRGSGLLAVGVTNWRYIGYFAQISEVGGKVTSSVTWGQIGGLPNGYFGATPLSAAIGYRPNSTKPVVAFGLTDGSVRLLDPTTSNPTPVAQITNLPEAPVAIDPMPRLDLSGTTDYAVALQVMSNVASGAGVFLTDGGGTTLTRNIVGVDGSGNSVTVTADFDSYRAWFPGYKQGRFTLQNNSPYPVTVTLPQSSSSGKGCWFAPSWADGGQQFPVSGVEIDPGGSAGPFSMGAYTAGSDGKCAADPDEHKSAVWRAYLVFTPGAGAADPAGGNVQAETRLVDVQLDPEDWSVSLTDQKGGSLPVTKSAATGAGAALGAWTFTLGGAAAPSVTGTAPSLTGYQITPAIQSIPSVYRFDVGQTTWSVLGLGATPRQVQGLIPPLQVQGLPATPGAKWANVGQLMPTGKLNVSGTTVTVPGATFFWENAVGGPQYIKFQVVPGGSTALTSASVNLSDLHFCYTTGATDATPCPTPPTVSNIGFNGVIGTQKVMANGLDQVLLATTVSAGSALPAGDDAYNKVFYRTGSATGALVTNLYRQDSTAGCDPDCYTAFVGVQPGPGAYLNTGGNAAVRRGTSLRGPSGQNAGYASSNSPNPTLVFALVQLQQLGYHSSAATVQGYSTNLAPATGSDTAVQGFGFTGCSGETTGSCLIAPTSASRAALYQAGSVESGPVIGALFTNQAQDSSTDLPLTWADDNSQAARHSGVAHVRQHTDVHLEAEAVRPDRAEHHSHRHGRGHPRFSGQPDGLHQSEPVSVRG